MQREQITAGQERVRMEDNLFFKFLSEEYNPAADRDLQIDDFLGRMIYGLEACLVQQGSLDMPSIRQLCMAAACSRNTFYVHFETTGNLMKALIRHVMAYDCSLLAALTDGEKAEESLLFRMIYRELQLIRFFRM